jgi:hypothetical protein
MATQGKGLGALTCLSCGAQLEPDVGDQFFCEYCGSPLSGDVPAWSESRESALPPATHRVPGSLPRTPGSSGWKEEAEELPDWMREVAPARVELRPATPPLPEAEKPRRHGGRAWSVLIVFGLILSLLCLLVWMICSYWSSRAASPSLLSPRSKLFVVSSQESWQGTEVYVREGQVVSITYLDGAWGVWGGARGAAKQVDAAGFEGDYRAVGLPLTSAPVGALLGRLGEGEPFLVGRKVQFVSGESGALRLMINDRSLEDNSGAMRVQVRVSSGH